MILLFWGNDRYLALPPISSIIAHIFRFARPLDKNFDCNMDDMAKEEEKALQAPAQATQTIGATLATVKKREEKTGLFGKQNL